MMSKIIILAEPAEGHINPFIPIMNRLSENGHQLVCITGYKFKQKVENTGALFQPLPAKWDPGYEEAYTFFPELQNKKG
ncbi:MAG: hypothetical protein GQ532_07760, partial [Methylomarinum sp.]|nr:hypothetical protein [Methylomarinum sp.]